MLAACIAACALLGCGSDDGDSDPGPTGSTPTAIGEARGLPADTEVTIEGVVTVSPGVYNSSLGDLGFGVQDQSGGVYVSIAEVVDAEVGDRVRVIGRLAQVAQQTTVIASGKAAVELLEGAGTVATTEVATGDVGESTEGSLVSVSGAVTQALVDDSPYGFKVFIDDGSGEVQIFVHIIDGEPLADVASIAVGQAVSATGFSGQYEATYEVMPRSASDFAVAQP